MSRDVRDELGDLLRDLRGDGSFATRQTAPVGELDITVGGVGVIRLPVTAAQAKELRLVARPAKYGHGEQTIHDRNVRDTWEVPRSRVKIDRRKWNRTLLPMLDTIRDDFGLPDTASLAAELHSMLVYEPGQFFAAHQDSEKTDQMIGSLIVMLPSNSTGGALVVEHGGESVEYHGSATSLTFVAFFADTRHEVLPVERGYRIVLTYNLMLNGDATPVGADAPELASAVAGLFERHFAEPSTPRWHGDRQAMEPPDRLVVLLDHQYTGRGLSWAKLKGDDAARVAILREAARASACDVALAHAEIQETWDAYQSAPPRRWGRSRWDDFDDDDDVDPDDLELSDLLDSSVTISPVAGGWIKFDPRVGTHELATPTPSDDLVPYETAYTGYMGNWGNTLDRWYRRAAIVIWPHERTFALRAKADPVGAIAELVASGPGDRADDLVTLLRFWSEGVRSNDPRELLPQALRLARELDEGTATALVEPFQIEAVAPADAAVMVGLLEQHGQQWFDQRIDTWMVHRHMAHHASTMPTRAAWVEDLAKLCTDLLDAAGERRGLGVDAAHTFVDRASVWLVGAIGSAAAEIAPSQRAATLAGLAEPTLAVMRAAVIVNQPGLRRRVVDAVTDEALDLTALLDGIVQAGAAGLVDEVAASGVLDIARHAERLLLADLARPERDHNDWSINDLADIVCCDDCAHLNRFLTDPGERKLTWPLAKPRRQHIHQRIDRAELPVTHSTVRTGSPHKLVLTKTDELFRRHAEHRRNTQASLAAVQRLIAAT